MAVEKSKLGFYCQTVTETKVTSLPIKVGDTFHLTTLFGKTPFVVKRLEENRAYLENNPKLAADLVFEDGFWVYKHCCYNPLAMVKVKLV